MQYFVVCESKVLCRVATWQSAILIAFSAYYTFNLEYPTEAKNIFGFSQDYNLAHPDSNNKTGTYLASVRHQSEPVKALPSLVMIDKPYMFIVTVFQLITLFQLITIFTTLIYLHTCIYSLCNIFTTLHVYLTYHHHIYHSAAFNLIHCPRNHRWHFLDCVYIF